MVPLDSTINIIEKQLIIVSIVVLILSIICAYFISKRLSDPIKKIVHVADLISKGYLNTTFESASDIEELKELTKSLNKMKLELSKTEELQKDLMANVSHDIKTPLTMIKAYAELIRDININNKSKTLDNLEIIIEEVNRLDVLVNDILTLTKIENNIDKLNYSNFDLLRLVKKIIKQHQIYQTKSGYKIILNCELNKVMIYACKERLEQVIYNLLNNAINYTGSDKTVIIEIKLQENYYVVSVIDSGKGISKKELKHIFEKYYRSKKNHKRYVYGTGLGLSIVKKILEDHNYLYGVNSKKNKGSCFYFKIKKD